MKRNPATRTIPQRPRSQKLDTIIAEFRREERLYRGRSGMDNVSSDMENILKFLYGRLADAFEELKHKCPVA